MNKRIATFALSTAMLMGLAVPAFAADVNQENSSTTIPVTISAEATIFDVTLPTQFPITVDPSTGEAKAAEDAEITNNSAGAIKVSKIQVDKAGEWKLAAYDTDMSKEKVDSNKIGVQVAPKGGRNATSGGTYLKTTDADADTQVLLDGTGANADQWIINGKGAGDESNKLTVQYGAKVSPVSKTVTNEQVASIILTVAWDAE